MRQIANDTRSFRREPYPRLRGPRQRKQRARAAGRHVRACTANRAGSDGGAPIGAPSTRISECVAVLRGRRPIPQSKQKSPQRMFPRGPDKLVSMMPLCRCFARRVKLQLQLDRDCFNRDATRPKRAWRHEKTRCGHSARARPTSLDDATLPVFCPTCQTTLRRLEIYSGHSILAKQRLYPASEPFFRIIPRVGDVLSASAKSQDVTE